MRPISGAAKRASALIAPASCRFRSTRPGLTRRATPICRNKRWDRQSPSTTDLAGLRRGDLVFWRGHVGIMRNETTLLHANAHHMLVASEPLRLVRDRNLAKSSQPISAIKRLATGWNIGGEISAASADIREQTGDYGGGEDNACHGNQNQKNAQYKNEQRDQNNTTQQEEGQEAKPSDLGNIDAAAAALDVPHPERVFRLAAVGAARGDNLWLGTMLFVWWEAPVDHGHGVTS